jgi:Bacterial Ig-like domain/LVIVD repeat
MTGVAEPSAPVDDNLPPSRPKGNIPSDSYPDDLIDLPSDRWRDGLISPTLESEHHNQPAVVNGYLQLTGNARFSTYDISDPTAPRQLSERVSPDNCATCGPAGSGEAEAHQVGFAKYGDQFYTATISGLGIDIWKITDAANPTHLQSVRIEGVNFGDFTEAVWGVYWQGTTIYVGGTNTGLHILDAADPTNVTLVNRLPTSMFGGVSAGPVFPVGNILVITTPKDSGGIATLDISDPHNPIALDAFTTTKSYIGSFYRHHVYLQEPLRVWDVLTDPTTIGTAAAPIGTLATNPSEYMSFSDEYMFLGLLRPDPGAIKINVADPARMAMESRIWGRRDLGGNDDQFTVAVGNLLVMSDDQRLTDGTLAGSVIAVHAAAPDTKPPRVDTIIPRNGATAQSTRSRIGFSFTDSVELATVDRKSLIVRPVGGAPIAGNWGAYTTVLNFDPEGELQPGTTYEVVLPAGGLTDYVGNGMAEDFSSTFTTR